MAFTSICLPSYFAASATIVQMGIASAEAEQSSADDLDDSKISPNIRKAGLNNFIVCDMCFARRDSITATMRRAPPPPHPVSIPWYKVLGRTLAVRRLIRPLSYRAALLSSLLTSHLTETAMGENKTVAWFADDAVQNRFFFRSPFRSRSFIANTVVLVAVILGMTFLVVRNWNSLSSTKVLLLVSVFMLQGTVYPYIRVLQYHRRVNELYLSGKITEQPAESPIDELLTVAERALIDGLFFILVTVGVLVFFLFFQLHKGIPI
jgi:hypothetical protein